MRKEPVILIDVPLEMGGDPYLTPVNDSLTPLDILMSRMQELAPLDRIVLCTGRMRYHSVFNRFAATRHITLYPTNEPYIMKRIMAAVAISRADTIIRVSANHVFADPEMLRILLNLHSQHKTAPDYSTLLNAPDWISGEVIETFAVQRAWDEIKGHEEFKTIQPKAFFNSRIDDYGVLKHRAPIRGTWQMTEMTLATQEGHAAIIEAIRQARNYEDITFKQFLV